MRGKPRSIYKWPIDDESKKVVTRELKKWISLLTDYADGRTGNVKRFNLLTKDFFFFTDCKDIVAKDPEFLAQETNYDIIRRKQYVFMQLVLKQLLRGPYKKILKCSHCGQPEEIKKTINGHYRFCPHCQKISMVGYMPTAKESLNYIIKEESK